MGAQQVPGAPSPSALPRPGLLLATVQEAWNSLGKSVAYCLQQCLCQGYLHFVCGPEGALWALPLLCRHVRSCTGMP